eukprot:c24426_g1_i1 orf=317-3322(+)
MGVTKAMRYCGWKWKARMEFCEQCKLMGLVRVIMVVWMWAAVTNAVTDSGDMAILAEFKKNMKNPELLKWEGDDACGNNWPHIVCDDKNKVSQIQVANLGLMGTLPANLNRLSALVNIGLQKNGFTGALPTLNGLQNLKYAYLDGNQFDSIPVDFFKNLPSLLSIALDYNPLNASSSGWALSSDITASTLLQNLSLTNVSLIGEIPEFLGTMSSLQVLHLAYNRLSGRIPASFSGSSLQVFQVNNQLGDEQLSGPIDVVGSMQSLSQLWLQVNKFTGTIPVSLANVVSLTDLKLNDNQLVGPIPWDLKNLFLTVFTAENNHLVGPIPPISAPTFNVQDNLFCHTTTGVRCSSTVNALLEFISALNYPSNIVQSWAGNDPCTASPVWTGIVCESGTVSAINLVNGNLNGSISPYISNLTSLVAIKLSGNNLTGTIPDSLTSLKSLTLLDVSDNNLSGPVPKFSSQVQVDIQGNPLVNVLSAAAPSTSNATRSGSSPLNSSYPTSPSGSSPKSDLNNSSVTPVSSPQIVIPADGQSSPSTINRAIPSSHEKSSSLSVTVIIGPVLGVTVLLLLLPLAMFLVYKKRKKKFLPASSAVVVYPRDSSSDRDVVKINLASQIGSTSDRQGRENCGSNEFQVMDAGNLVISVQVLCDVTDNFSEENILGRGGFGVVYKGELHDGTKIAVKRMEAAVISSKGLNEFQAEIAVLTKVRHRHLVALLGYCIDGNERLLVYEHMPQGPLSKHLFDREKQQLKPLDWKKRLTIALDVARGMEYLHGLAHKSFIHRDLKPSNILLDDDYRAKVSDFGLVKLAPEGKDSVETRLAGTFGYLAPEYAVTGRITTKSDVFSFGVVLMELITGRRALDESQPEESMHLVSWFRRANISKESFRGSIDPALEVTEERFESICTVAELAGHCTGREPHQRPDMSHAVSVLAPLVDQWKPVDFDMDDFEGIDLEMTLPQALKKWQAFEGASITGHGLDDTTESLPTYPTGFAESFTSADGR